MLLEQLILGLMSDAVMRDHKELMVRSWNEKISCEMHLYKLVRLMPDFSPNNWSCTDTSSDIAQ